LMNPIDPESLIYRFAKQLEFGSSTMLVASEAVKIVQRMNRDWMTTGRRPAGICGAALILAARMNNFRRTVREVVYVVKVTEITISQRLNEFSSTESGELTVDQFRSVQLENSHDPPSFTRAREGRKPARSLKSKAAETAAEIEEDLSEEEPEPSQPRRVDADGFAIPSLPIDPALIQADKDYQAASIAELDESEAASSRNRPKGGRKKLPSPSPEQVASEEALEEEMSGYLTKGSNMIESIEDGSTTQQPRKAISDDPEIDEAEFESDPEVSNCLLSAAEVEIKERIWVHENKDYLRIQQAKALKRALEEADAPPGDRKPRKRRKGRLGDVRYLEGEGEGDDKDGRSTRASTPAEATRRMLERRGFSKKINYRLLETLFGEEEGSEDSKVKGDAGSHIRSRSQSVISRRSASVDPEATKRTRFLGTTSTPTKPAGTSLPAPAAPIPAESPTERKISAENVEQKHPTDPAQGPADPDDEADDYDDEEGEEDDADMVDAAFSGQYDYYDEGSDYDSE
jgi:transcription factor IIIB subunit 2